MSLAGFGRKSIKDLRGAWTRVDGVTMRANRAFVAQNVRFSPGRVKTREGLENRLNVSDRVAALYNWITSAINRIIFLESTTAKLYNIATSSTDSLFTEATAVGMVVAEAATRAYLAVFKTDGTGAGQARVVNALISGVPADKAFSAPYQVDTQSVTEPSAGDVTAGTHYFGFVSQSRTGFLGPPGPVDGGNTFTPFSAVASGAFKARYAIQIDTRADAGFVYPVMTRADNPDRWYFVPSAFGGLPVALPPSVNNWAVSWDIDISDEDLATFGELLENEFDYLTQDQAAAGPITPNAVKAYGRRMAYIADDDVYFSDEDAAQVITLAFHLLQTPEQRSLYNAVVVRGVFYGIGKNWTYSFTDRRGQLPVAWEAPQLVSNRIGAVGPNAMTDRTGWGGAWVAHESGLYPFNGEYAAKPISYMQQDWWARITPGSYYTVQVHEDILNRRVMVLAPLDGSVQPSHLLIWDFSRGFDPMEADFHWDYWAHGRSSIASVLENDSRTYLWMGPSGVGHQIQRYVDGLLSDGGLAIDSQYQTGHMLAEGEGDQKNWVRGPLLDIEGAGNAEVTVYSPAETRTAGPHTLALSASADQEEFIDMQLSEAENASVLVKTNAVGAWFDLRRVTVYFRKQATNR